MSEYWMERGDVAFGENKNAQMPQKNGEWY
jgi:hypothetical protein